MQEGADISQCPGVRRCVSPTGSLLVDWTLKPSTPGNRNQRTDTLEAFVGPRSDSGLTISGYGPASDVKLWCYNPRRQSTSQVTFSPVQPRDISLYWKLTWARWSPPGNVPVCPALHSVSSLHTWPSWCRGLAEQPFKIIPFPFTCSCALSA